jgi:outer membrane receptor protein involved in Fe transport
MRGRDLVVLMVLTLATMPAAAADDPAAKLPLDELLATPISTAAKYDQQMSSVAASVTVITAEEIQRYGWTNLAEVVQSIPGFYVTYDRKEPYIGVRGIGRPTDNNTRLLILLDGMPIAEPIFGESSAGDNMVIDPAMIEKIEIIRGPGSALYGTHAMLAVINIFTKTADAIDGTSVTALAGSHGQEGASLRMGRVLANGMAVTASGFWQQTDGANLYFPEYDTPATNDGVAVGRDYQHAERFMVTLRRGGLRLSLSSRKEKKGLPTAMWETNFNQDEFIGSSRQDATLEYRHSLGSNKRIELRGYWTRRESEGDYPYDDLGIDHSNSNTAGAEARLQWDLSPKQRITGGTELTDGTRANYWFKVGDYKIEIDRPYRTSSVYLQYEAHPAPRWEVVAGMRRDDFSATADSTNPRAAILFTPSRSTSLKLLYGSAFRSPSIYEANYNDPITPWKSHPDLKPESIRTTELVWEQRLSSDTLMTASAYHISAKSLIDEQLEPDSQIYWYNNVGELVSNGMELGVHVRRNDGVWMRLSATLQQADSDGAPVTNSPQVLLKGRLSTSPWATWSGGIEGIYEAARRTRDAERTDPYLLMNGILSRQIGTQFRIALTARNLLNTGYSLPVGPELRPQSIRQDGRTFTLRLTYTK